MIETIAQFRGDGGGCANVLIANNAAGNSLIN